MQMDAAKVLVVSEGSSSAEQKTRILLVDEHAITAEIERNYLAGVGFEVVLSTDSEQAISKVASESFDLIMIDTSFRGDKGVDTLKLLKARSQNRNIKAIVSGLSFPPPLKQRVRDAGADEIFVKPVPRPQVLREIKRLTANEVRGTERVQHSVNMVLKWDEGVHNCLTLDVSTEGVHLSAIGKTAVSKAKFDAAAGGEKEIRPPIGAMVEMDIQLTKTESLSKVQGEVMRHTAEGFGVRFLKLKKADQKKLDKHILRHSLEHAASHFYL
jgi:CheY-like chemotaxis protein